MKNFIRRLFSRKEPPSISPFQKQSRLWFVLRAPTVLTPEEQNAKFFRVCDEAFSLKQFPINWGDHPPTEKQLYCEHCGCLALHHHKCFTWVSSIERNQWLGLHSRDTQWIISQYSGYLYKQGERIRQEEERGWRRIVLAVENGYLDQAMHLFEQRARNTPS